MGLQGARSGSACRTAIPGFAEHTDHIDAAIERTSHIDGRTKKGDLSDSSGQHEPSTCRSSRDLAASRAEYPAIIGKRWQIRDTTVTVDMTPVCCRVRTWGTSHRRRRQPRGHREVEVNPGVTGNGFGTYRYGADCLFFTGIETLELIEVNGHVTGTLRQELEPFHGHLRRHGLRHLQSLLDAGNRSTLQHGHEDADQRRRQREHDRGQDRAMRPESRRDVHPSIADTALGQSMRKWPKCRRPGGVRPSSPRHSALRHCALRRRQARQGRGGGYRWW